MKKILYLLAILLFSSCSTTRDLVDYNLLKNELNQSIREGFPESDYMVK